MDSDEVDNACDVIQSVASESNRYTGRKERSQQRSVFKDLVSAVEVIDSHSFPCGVISAL